MVLSFAGTTIEWRGPAPFVFVSLPPEEAETVKALARELSYGWGCIPVTVRIGGTRFTTSLMPRQGGYLVPIKVAVQRAERVEVGQQVDLTLDFSKKP
jgi:hypothetical protein